MIRLLALAMKNESDWGITVAADTLAHRFLPLELHGHVYQHLESDGRFRGMQRVEGIHGRASQRAAEHMQNRSLRRTEESRYDEAYGPPR